jgi:hypothetical protein
LSTASSNAGWLRSWLEFHQEELVSPNGADFDPATLHDWLQYAQVLAERARKWDLSAT